MLLSLHWGDPVKWSQEQTGGKEPSRGEPEAPSGQAGGFGQQPPRPSAPGSQHQPQLSPRRKVPVEQPSGDLQQLNATHGSWEQERFKIYIIYTFIIHPLNPLYANHDLVSAVTFP